jgi:hypothetical protein
VIVTFNLKQRAANQQPTLCSLFYAKQISKKERKAVVVGTDGDVVSLFAATLRILLGPSFRSHSSFQLSVNFYLWAGRWATSSYTFLSNENNAGNSL